MQRTSGNDEIDQGDACDGRDHGEENYPSGAESVASRRPDNLRVSADTVVNRPLRIHAPTVPVIGRCNELRAVDIIVLPAH